MPVELTSSLQRIEVSVIGGDEVVTYCRMKHGPTQPSHGDGVSETALGFWRKFRNLHQVVSWAVHASCTLLQTTPRLPSGTLHRHTFGLQFTD